MRAIPIRLAREGGEAESDAMAKQVNSLDAIALL